MKVSTLIAWLDDGTLHSVASETAQPIDELAGIVRKERSITIGKKTIPVVQALVLQSNGGSARLSQRIMCASDANREALVAEQKKAEAKKAEDAVKKPAK